MTKEIRVESDKLGAEYGEALAHAENCEGFWRANPIFGPADQHGRFPTQTLDGLLEASKIDTPDAAWRDAMNKLASWRQFRVTHGLA